LGYALAHEVGHVLLRSESHGSAGLMRGIWSRADWQCMATVGLWFTMDEASAMRRELRRVQGAHELLPASGPKPAWGP
jgi:hypothetical protein